jgi:acyl transferase domain-containing protein/NADPH:quinone reductase-like Zn-dependent oxidoreductase/acyl carrier protein
VLSNRISYAFDFHGASFTVDSACSSSFVALNEAMAALRDRRVDLALVAGVNLLLSPAPFIGFSQARMLSPTGLSRPFSQDADGYVRSEGAVVVLLRRLEDAQANGERVRSVIMGSSVNSDGRTSGISLPSLDGQKNLIQSLYGDMGLDPKLLSFVEAHGTGTKAGDPIEATAIGEALGQKRTQPLLIGSAKSNVGHLEAVSGLVGLLKTSLAMQHGLLPRSVFSENLNESIDFAALNLKPAQSAVRLDPHSGPLMASICNYGFGGTNAHVVMRGGERAFASQIERPANRGAADAQVLVISASTREALTKRVRQMNDVLAKGTSPRDLAAVLGHQRELQQYRLALPLADTGAVVPALKAFEQGSEDDQIATFSSASWDRQKVAFVFSGNGCQFKEMGKAAFKASTLFRREIEDLDRLFRPMSGWSIAETLKNGVSQERLAQTSVSQPLIYAIQSALVACLAKFGIKPDLVLGHSMGEVAAAEASGALTRAEAVKVIYLRSQHQEAVRGKGTMLVVAADEATTRTQLVDFGGTGIEIAATNSAASTTVSGPSEALSAFARYCRRNKVATIRLDIDYPFHSSALEPVKGDILRDLADIETHPTHTVFMSTVTGEHQAGGGLDADYWWRNIRQPVLFGAAVAKAVEEGNLCFVEIGPRAILTGAIKEILRAGSSDGQTMSTLSDKDTPIVDPVMAIVVRLISHGVGFDKLAVFGKKPDRPIALPNYPFQRQEFTLGGTSEAVLFYGRMVGAGPRHALLGGRMADGSPEWRNLLDPTLVPWLADHRVDGGVIVPASGLIDMALQVGKDLYGDSPLELVEFDIWKALVLAADETREVSTRWSEQSETVEIWSRKRFAQSNSDWLLHARGRVVKSRRPRSHALPPPIAADRIAHTKHEVYAEATRAGLEYGPLFQLVSSSERDHWTTDAILDQPRPGVGSDHGFVLHPISLDAALHSLFIARPQKDGETKAHMPVRFRKVCVWDHGAPIHRAITYLTQETDRFKTIMITLLSEEGVVAASIEAVVLRAVILSKASIPDRTFHSATVPLARPELGAAFEAIRLARTNDDVPVLPLWLLVKAFCVSLAHRVVTHLTEDGVGVSPDTLIASGRVSENARSYLGVMYDLLSEFGTVANSDGEPGTFTSLRFPAPESILATLVTRFQAANVEIRLCAKALEHAEDFLRTGEFPPTPQWMVRRFESEALIFAPAIKAMTEALERLVAASPKQLRVLAIEPFSYGLTRAVMPLVQAGRIEVTFASKDAGVLEIQRSEFGPEALVDFLLLGPDTPDVPIPFDVLISLAVTAIAADDATVLSEAADLLHSSAPVIVGLPGSDPTLDMLCGLWEHWLQSGVAGFVQGQIPLEDTIARRLRKAGIEDIESKPTSDGLGRLLLGSASADRANENGFGTAVGPVTVLADRSEHSRAGDLMSLIPVLITGDEPATELAAWLENHPVDEVPTLIVPAHALSEGPTEQLARRIEYLKGVLECLDAAKRKVRVFVITEGANDGASDNGPVESGIWAFVRVAINEYPAIDLRLIDVLPGGQIEQLAKVISLTGNELEWIIGADGASANRVRRGIVRPEPLKADQRSVLRFEQPGRLDSFVWQIDDRREPDDNEIEIEVAAVGLNFRDILVGLGILDDDLLGAGLTAASLGFECSGTVTRVGANVTRLKVGDEVMGFARDVFASHIVTPDWHFFPVPAGTNLEAAASIPVAFATAWYSLIDRAHLKAGEDVLIHGAAGGVGLAAIQIAKRAGARVLATASNETRRRIGKSAGADLLFDSRQERFADPIANSVGGVDVVLNSLAGPAMLASFKLVRPFGRFVELGKRDYLDNTQLGLRPFVRNIQYSGVDLDELLAHDRRGVETLMATISEAFVKRELSALPYQVYESHEIGKAFRSMQASEHMGKIVVRPPHVAQADLTSRFYKADPGVYLIVGGTSGFGFQTARWLAAKGATTLVLASRRGRMEEGLESEVAHLRASGVTVLIEALDVTDASAVKKLVDYVSAVHGPILGVVHAAVVLEDGLINSLVPDRLRTSLAAKTEGAINLDAALEGQPLEFFVLYSSATTVIGSPGQGAYVAANAFLEGFARKRRAAGKPALSIGWGAISDAGIIARDKKLGERLRRTTGVVSIRSSELLAQLGRLLLMGDAAHPTQFYTNIGAGAAAAKLTLLNSPAFRGLALVRHDEAGDGSADLTSAIAGKSKSEALVLITQAMRREVATILRMAEAQIDPSRPLSELGLDSLMALELHMGIERLSGAQIPMVGINNRRLSDIAGLIYSEIAEDTDDRAPTPTVDATGAQIMQLLEAHTSEGIAVEDVGALQQKLKAAATRGVAE